MEVLVHPFSFREAVLHTGDETPRPVPRPGPPAAVLYQRLRLYLGRGQLGGRLA